MRVPDPGSGTVRHWSVPPISLVLRVSITYLTRTALATAYQDLKLIAPLYSLVSIQSRKDDDVEVWTSVVVLKKVFSLLRSVFSPVQSWILVHTSAGRPLCHYRTQFAQVCRVRLPGSGKIWYRAPHIVLDSAVPYGMSVPGIAYRARRAIAETRDLPALQAAAPAPSRLALLFTPRDRCQFQTSRRECQGLWR
eukprot:2516312-Rhodomonas_salina.2